jgi:hypothetical protein
MYCEAEDARGSHNTLVNFQYFHSAVPTFFSSKSGNKDAHLNAMQGAEYLWVFGACVCACIAAHDTDDTSKTV